MTPEEIVAAAQRGEPIADVLERRVTARRVAELFDVPEDLLDVVTAPWRED